MRETYDIIIEKLERDKKRFSEDLYFYLDDCEINENAKMFYTQARAKKDYCMDLIDFFKEVRDRL